MNYEQDLHWASKVRRERRTEREGRSVLLKQFKIQTDLKLVESDMVKYCDISAESTKNQQLPISLLFLPHRADCHRPTSRAL